jgi:hypothetical protein
MVRVRPSLLQECIASPAAWLPGPHARLACAQATNEAAAPAHHRNGPCASTVAVWTKGVR